MITYSNGLYNIDLWNLRFISEGIIATKVLATDAVEDTYLDKNNNEIPYMGVVCMPEYSLVYDPDTDGYTTDFITVPYRQILVSYSDGNITNVKISEEKNISYTMVAVWDGNPYKMFLWSPGLTEPICRAIDIPGLGSSAE